MTKKQSVEVKVTEIGSFADGHYSKWPFKLLPTKQAGKLYPRVIRPMMLARGALGNEVAAAYFADTKNPTQTCSFFAEACAYVWIAHKDHDLSLVAIQQKIGRKTRMWIADFDRAHKLGIKHPKAGCAYRIEVIAK